MSTEPTETVEQRIDRLEAEVTALRERLERLLVVLEGAKIISVARERENA
jgi:hypothetical protein